MSKNKEEIDNEKNLDAPPLSYSINIKNSFSLFQDYEEDKKSEIKEICLEMNVIQKLTRKKLIELFKFLSTSCAIALKNENDYLNFLNNYNLKNIQIKNKNEQQKNYINNINMEDVKIELDLKNRKYNKSPINLLSNKKINYQINNNYFQQEPNYYINNFIIPKSKNNEKEISKDNNYSPEINLPKRNIYKQSKNEDYNKKIEIDNNLYILNKNLNNNIDRIEINKDRDNEMKKNKKKKKGGKFVDFDFKNIFKK